MFIKDLAKGFGGVYRKPQKQMNLKISKVDLAQPPQKNKSNNKTNSKLIILKLKRFLNF